MSQQQWLFMTPLLQASPPAKFPIPSSSSSSGGDSLSLLPAHAPGAKQPRLSRTATQSLASWGWTSQTVQATTTRPKSLTLEPKALQSMHRPGPRSKHALQQETTRSHAIITFHVSPALASRTRAMPLGHHCDSGRCQDFAFQLPVTNFLNKAECTKPDLPRCPERCML